MAWVLARDVDWRCRWLGVDWRGLVAWIGGVGGFGGVDGQCRWLRWRGLAVASVASGETSRSGRLISRIGGGFGFFGVFGRDESSRSAHPWHGRWFFGRDKPKVGFIPVIVSWGDR